MPSGAMVRECHHPTPHLFRLKKKKLIVSKNLARECNMKTSFELIMAEKAKIASSTFSKLTS
jgi:hypothetical protein